MIRSVEDAISYKVLRMLFVRAPVLRVSVAILKERIKLFIILLVSLYYFIRLYVKIKIRR